MESGKQNSSKTPNGNWTDEELQVTKDLLNKKGLNLNATMNTTYDTLNLSDTAEVIEMSPQDQHLNEVCGAKKQSRTDINECNGKNSINLDGGPKSIPSVLRIPENPMTLNPADVKLYFSVPDRVLDIKSNGVNCKYSPSVTLHSSRIKPIKLKKFFENNKTQLNSQFYAATFTALQAQRTELFRKKFEWERKQHVKQMDLNKKKLAIQEEWTKAEIDFRKKELELMEKEIAREEKLRILYMEKDERLEKYELDLKYLRQ